MFSPIGRQCFSLVPEIQYCFFYFTFQKIFCVFILVLLSWLFCCIIFNYYVVGISRVPQYFKKMRVRAHIIMSRVPRLSCKSRLCFKKGVLKISSYKPAHVNTAGAQSTVLVWSYTLAAVPILGSAPSDVSLLWAD